MNPLRFWQRALLACLLGMLALASATTVRAEDRCGKVVDCAQQMVDMANDLKTENATLMEELAKLREEVAQLRTDLAAEALATTTADAALKAAVNTSLTGLTTFGPGTAVGLDMNDDSHGNDNRQERHCDSSQFMTGFQAFMEGGHLKFVALCSALSPVPLP